MKITLKQHASAGDATIPPGEYMVSLQMETRQINLAGHGNDYKIPAIQRPGKKPTRITDIQFIPAGGPTWTVVVKTPKQGEWIGTLRYTGDAPKTEE